MQQLNAPHHHAPTSSILFESATNSIAFFPAREGFVSDSCVIIYSAWSGRALCGKIAGTEPLLRAGIDVFSVQSNCDDWHQGIPPEVYGDLSDLLGKTYQNRFGYGSSMGGYGALLFASILNLDVVLAMSPQYTIQENFDTRWRAYVDRVHWHYDINKTASTYRGKVFVTFDPYNIDAQHFSLIQNNFKLAEVVGIEAKFSGHPTAAYLHESQYLKKVAVDVLTSGIVPDFSVNNKKNKIYLLALSQHLLKNRNKTTSALIAAKACLELGDERHAFFRHISEIYGRMDDLKQAVKYAHCAVNAKNNNPSSTKTHLEHLASMQRLAGNLDGALATIEELLILDSKRGTAHMNKSTILLTANDRTGALASALTAVELGDTRNWTFRHLSNLYNRLGNAPKAIEFAELAIDAKDNTGISLNSHRAHLANLQQVS